MKIAIIDLGTNTFNLLIAMDEGKGLKVVYKDRKSVKLGEGGILRGRILEEAADRGVAALNEYREEIEKQQVDDVYAIATSAVRSASNGAQFVARIKNECGFYVNIISGNEEAGLIYEGLRSAGDLVDENTLIMDIGGGSTEFIIGNHFRYSWARSFDLGAARLLAWVSPDDVITEAQIEKLTNMLELELLPLFGAMERYRCSKMVGTSGSFETLASILSHRQGDETSGDELGGFEFNVPELKKLMKEIVASTLQERLAMKGMAAMRADMIVMSCIMIQSVFNSSAGKGPNRVVLSNAALKEGVLSMIEQKKVTWQKS